MPPVMQSLHFLKVLLDTLELVLKHWHFLITYHLSVLAKNVDIARFEASSTA